MDMAEAFHDLHDLAAEGALGIGPVRGIARRGLRPAIALEVEADDAVGLGQRRGDAVPARMGLGEAVQQQEGRRLLRTADAGEGTAIRRVDPAGGKARKQVRVHSSSPRPDRTRIKRRRTASIPLVTWQIARHASIARKRD